MSPRGKPLAWRKLFRHYNYYSDKVCSDIDVAGMTTDGENYTTFKISNKFLSARFAPVAEQSLLSYSYVVSNLWLTWSELLCVFSL